MIDPILSGLVSERPLFSDVCTYLSFRNFPRLLVRLVLNEIIARFV